MLLSIKEVKKDLGYTDSRSAYRWLCNNGVRVLCDAFSNRRYVIKREYEAARHRAAVIYVSAKYGKDKLPDFLNAQMKFHSEYMSVDQVLKTTKKSKQIGEQGQKFLQRLTKIIGKQ